jgi:hypothetical protein
MQLFFGGIIPYVSEDSHVVIMLRSESDVSEDVPCSNTAVRTTNVLTVTPAKVESMVSSYHC